jgi:hypothetical protein
VTLHRTPDRSRDRRIFRILGWGIVILLLGICIVSIYEPVELADPGRRALAWTAGAIVLAVVVLAMVLSSRAGLRKLTEGLQFELSDGKIVQRCEGQQTIEIALAQIESLNEYPRWLIIRGREPARQVMIPSEVSGFEELKRELSAYKTITSVKAKTRLFHFLSFVVMIVACLYLFASHNSAFVLVAGVVVLLLQGLGFYSIWRLRKYMLRPNLLLIFGILVWFVTAWIVYERTKGAM